MLKNIKIEAAYTKKRTINEAFNFYQNSPLGIQNAYSSKFFIGRSTSEVPFITECEAAISDSF